VKYVKYQPSVLLEKYIDFYWTLETDSNYKTFNVPLFADACTDIFINFGNITADFNGDSSISPGRIYMGGLSTSAGFVRCFPNSIFIGVRFKPGGLPLFFNTPLFEMVDQIIEFQDNHLFSIMGMDGLLPVRLDQYFLSKKRKPTPVIPITEAVHYFKGQISVDQLAQKCNVSNRTMERLFYTNMGIGPKEFISIVRFQQVLKALQKGYSKGQLLQIAFEMGYYDQAHFIKDVKKHSGLTPSAIGPGPSFP
jgi:AraC-like DNA-binding protein